MKIKEKLLENDIGAYLYDIRMKKGYTIEELAEIIDMPSVTIKVIRKWEHDLEFPNLEQMYKLSEIYNIPSEMLMQLRNETLQNGVNQIHKELIRFIGYILGFSIYGTIILSYVILFFAFIWSLIYFVNACKDMETYYLTHKGIL